jgi:hypothetical protein
VKLAVQQGFDDYFEQIHAPEGVDLYASIEEMCAANGVKK